MRRTDVVMRNEANPWVNRVLREPLFHFLVIGALLFAGYGLVNDSRSPVAGAIVVSRGQLASMRDMFVRTRQRPPTAEEWDGLIRARVREEVFYREALALGLDRDDAIIRRRLQQKIEFISADAVAQAEPTDSILEAYRRAHPEKFPVPLRFTFRQVYLNPQQHGPHLARDADRLLSTLRRPGGDENLAAMGDPLLLEGSYAQLPAAEVVRQFGDTFAVALAGLPAGSWQGPVSSAYGVHLVFLAERTGGRAPPLAVVRDAVRREWEAARAREADEAFYRGLLDHYTITIENEVPAGEGRTLGLAR